MSEPWHFLSLAIQDIMVYSVLFVLKKREKCDLKQLGKGFFENLNCIFNLRVILVGRKEDYEFMHQFGINSVIKDRFLEYSAEEFVTYLWRAYYFIC